MAKIKNLINKYNSKIRIHKDIILLNNKTMKTIPVRFTNDITTMKTIPVRFTNDITKEQDINCIDMSHLCKDKKTENFEAEQRRLDDLLIK
jgi:hypothetical protein